MAEITWHKEADGSLAAYAHGKKATWAPQPGSQQAFLECPVFEVLYSGTRGPGKTDALLMDFAQEVGKGWGADWRGIIFRRTYPELKDIITKSKKWFPRIWPDARFHETHSEWRWPTGETLIFSHFLKESDYWSYHGHAYPFIGWEELTTWPDDVGYKKMMSCSRSTAMGMPRKYRATTNPYGIGHNWVKLRFQLPVPSGKIIGRVIKDSLDDEGNIEPPRVAIHGKLYENKILLNSDPEYIQKVRAAARNANERKAWVEGNWDIVAGGMFDDVWAPKYHVIPNIPLDRIPRRWKIDRSYDHGQSKPFSVGWWAESNGEPIKINGVTIGAIKGDLIRIAEWYGWTGKANEGTPTPSVEIGQGIVDREMDWGIRHRVHGGVADSAIFDDYEPDKSTAGDMESVGVLWDPIDKGPGSRAHGWEQMRQIMKNSIPQNGLREKPGLFVTERCTQFIRTIPVLPRDDKNLDDVDTDAEDHVADETRYKVRARDYKVRQGNF